MNANAAACREGGWDAAGSALREYCAAFREFSGLVRQGKVTTAIRRRARVSVDVLVIDDDPDWPDVVDALLRDEGFAPNVIPAGCASVLRSVVSAIRPDAVLCDHRMPDLTSADALTIVRAAFPDVPVILVTGTLPPEEGAALVRMGAAAWISKDTPELVGPALAREVRNGRG